MQMKQKEGIIPAGMRAESTTELLKCVWEKEALTERMMRRISRKVSSLPWSTSKAFQAAQKALSVAGFARLEACTRIARARSTSPTSVSSLEYLGFCSVIFRCRIFYFKIEIDCAIPALSLGH